MNNQRGTTLITVIVSIAILAIALSAAASAFISASRLTKHAANYTTASNFAQSEMERVLTQPFESIRTTEVPKGLPALSDARCVVTVDRPEPLLKQITVTCSWVEGKTAHSVRFSSLAAGGRRR